MQFRFKKSLFIVSIISMSFGLPCHENHILIKKAWSAEDVQISQDQQDRRKEDAVRYRAEAAAMTDRAERYKKMADDAKAQEKESTHDLDKKHWRESAEKREKMAEDLLADARSMRDKADKAETGVQELGQEIVQEKTKNLAEGAAQASEKMGMDAQRAKDKKTTRNEKTCQFKNSYDLIGQWQYDGWEDNEALAIVQKNPSIEAYPNELEFHNKGRIWNGRFNSDQKLSTEKPQMVFKYKPKAKEINDDIPDVVRTSLAEKLEWELEILPECKDGVMRLYAMFYSGEIKWNEDDFSFEILGRGKGQRFELNPLIDIESVLSYESAIGIRVDPAQDPFIQKAESLTQSQRFHIKVRLSPEDAKKAGKRITLELEGLTSGETDTLTLTAGKVKERHAVYYTHKEPVTLAHKKLMYETSRDPGLLSVDWMFGNKGHRFNLDAKNGETIRISYRDLSFDVTFYQSPYFHGHARMQQAATQARTVYQGLLNGSVRKINVQTGEEEPVTLTDTEQVRKTLRMIQNYDVLMQSDKLHMAHKFAIGEAYFGSPDLKGLLNYTDAEVKQKENYMTQEKELHDGPLDSQTGASTDLAKGALESMLGRELVYEPGLATKDKDLVWTSNFEKTRIKEIITNVSKEKRIAASQELVNALTFGLYAGVLIIPSFGENMVVLLEGVDAFGNKKQGWERVMAAVNIGSDIVLSITGSGVATQISKELEMQKDIVTRVATNTDRLSGPVSNGGLFKRAIKDIDAPHKLKPDQKLQTQLILDPDPTLPMGSSIPAKQCTLRQSTKTSGGKNIGQQILDELSDEYDRGVVNSARPTYLNTRYDKTIKVIEDFSEKFTVQSNLPICQGKVLSWFGFKDKKFEISESLMHQLMMRAANMETKTNRVNLLKAKDYNAKALQIGYYNFMVRRAARMLGYSALESKDALLNNHKLRIGHIAKLLEDGYHVKVGIKLKGGAKEMHATHAVSVEKVIVDARGYPTHVQFFDPNVAAILELAADDFKNILVMDGSYGNITAFKR